MAHRWGMVIDLDKCTGCQACVLACKVENNVPVAGPHDASIGRAISWIEVMMVREGGGSHKKIRFIPTLCMHCEKPPCIKVCPVGATYKNEEGLIGQVYSRCIGCRYCTNNCPYTAKYFNWRTPIWPEEMKPMLNPEVSVRPKGVVEKCSFCHHRLIRAREKARAEGTEDFHIDYVPACVEICPSGAMYFGDLNNPNSSVCKLSTSPRAFRRMEDLGTEPKVFYLSEVELEEPA